MPEVLNYQKVDINVDSICKESQMTNCLNTIRQ